MTYFLKKASFMTKFHQYAFFDSSKKHSDEIPSARKAQYDPKQLYTVDVDAD